MSRVGIVLEVTDKATPVFTDAANKAQQSAQRVGDAWEQSKRRMESLQWGNVVSKDAQKAEQAFTTMRGAAQETVDTLNLAGVSSGILGRALSALTNPIALVMIAAFGLAAALVASADAFGANAKEVKGMMVASGLGAEAADNLASTFKLLGNDSSVVSGAMFKMAQEIDSGGSALKRLGVSVFDSTGHLKTEGQVFLEVRDKISQMGSASQRNAALIDLFGRSGRELAAAFGMSKDEFEKWAQRAAELSPWNAELQGQATAYNRAITELAMAWDGLVIRVGAAVAPILTSIVRITSETVLRFGTAIDTIKKYWNWMWGNAPEAQKQAEEAARSAGIPIQIQLAMQKSAIDERLRHNTAFLDAALAQEQARRQAGMTTEEYLLEVERQTLNQRKGVADAWYAEESARLTRAGDQYGQQQQDLTNKHRAMTEAILAQLGVLYIKQSDLQRRRNADEIAAATAAQVGVRTLMEKQTDVVAREYRDQENLLDQQRANEFITEQQYDAAIARLRKNRTQSVIQAAQQERIAELEKTAAMQEDAGQYFRFIGTQLEIARAQAGTTYANMATAVQSFASNAQNTLSSALFDFFHTGVLDMEKVFKGLMDSMLKAISDFVAQQAVKQILNLATSANLGGIVNGVASAIGVAGSAAGGAIGSLIGSIGGLFAASGGMVPHGTDTVPAMLTPGEVVIPADLARRLGIAAGASFLGGGFVVGGDGGNASGGIASAAVTNAAPTSFANATFTVQGMLANALFGNNTIDTISEESLGELGIDTTSQQSGVFGNVFGALGNLFSGHNLTSAALSLLSFAVPGIGKAFQIANVVSAPLVALAMLMQNVFGQMGQDTNPHLGPATSTALSLMGSMYSGTSQIAGLLSGTGWSLGQMNIGPQNNTNFGFRGIDSEPDGGSPSGTPGVGPSGEGTGGVGGGGGAAAGGSTGFARGGTIPGSYPGQPRRVIAHAGEEYLGVGKWRRGGGGMVIHNHITVESGDAAWIDKNARLLRRALERELGNLR